MMEQESTPTSRLHTLETRLPTVEAFQTFLCNVDRYIQELPTYTNKKRIALMDAILNRINSVQIPIGLKTFADNFVNEVVSAKDGFENEIDIEEVDFEAFDRLKDMNSKLLNSIKMRIEDLKKNGDLKLHAHTEEKQVVDVLSKAKDELKRLKRATNKPWMICRAPVIPIPANAYFVLEKLHENFRTSVLCGCPILHDQLVIGINRGLSNLSNCEPLLNKLIAKLEARKKVKFIRPIRHGVSSESSGQGIVWYWVMPEDEADRFRGCFRSYGRGGTGSKTLNLQGIALKDWGLADGS